MDGQLIQKKDCSAAVAAALPEAKSLADAGKLADAVELLLGVEKQARMGNDVPSLKEVVLQTVRLVREHNDWEQLNATLTQLSKRRSQNKAAITAMVQEAMGPSYVDAAPDADTKKKLIVTLRDITDGKIFVEAERARLTRSLAHLLEAEGKVGEACDIIQDVHVETYGSLDKQEKLDFILEQIRLTLAKKDFVRTYIIAKKVTKKLLDGEDPALQVLKLKFYRLMIEYHSLAEKEAFEIAQHYHSIYDTPVVKAEEAQWKEALSSCVLFLIIAPHSNQQSDMLHRLVTEEADNLTELPIYKEILKTYTTKEIIRYPLPQLPEIEVHPALTQYGPELAQHWLAQLRTRVIQHNIRVLSGYYKKIRLTRAADLLSLAVPELETNIATLVSEGSVYARVDRPANQVCFAPPKVAEEALSDWAADISELLHLVERTTHLISKEMMIHKVV
jgi:26S proteasome regulatory subunit N5